MLEKKAVQVVLLNDKGEVLAVSRKDNHKDFGLVGGKVDPEDPDEISAAIREAKEETGLDISNLRLVFAIHKYTRMQYTYLAEWSGKIEYDEPHLVKWVPWSVVNQGSFGEFNFLVAKSLDSMGVKFLKEKMPDEQYLYAIDLKNRIHITRKSHWEEFGNKGSVSDGNALEDLHNLCENGRIMLHDYVVDRSSGEEVYYISKKDTDIISGKEEIRETLTASGFIFCEEFQNYINGK